MNRQSLPIAVLCLLPLLSGCVTRVRTVRRTRPPSIVQAAPIPSLIDELDQRYDSIQTMSATVEITASTGGGKTGEVKEFPAFSGYIFLRKPEELRVLLLVPVLRSKALDMVSDGKSFKLLIPPRNKAITGTNVPVAKPSANGLENLRPYVFFDSLLVRGPNKEQIVSRTLETRIVEPPVVPGQLKRGDLIEEPDYDIEMLGKPNGQIVKTQRVVHINRENLLPYRQEIYDEAGQIVTRASYSNYQTFGNVQFPTMIRIERPLDLYTLNVSITKLVLNEKLEDDQFELKVPETVPITVMK